MHFALGRTGYHWMVVGSGKSVLSALYWKSKFDVSILAAANTSSDLHISLFRLLSKFLKIPSCSDTFCSESVASM